MENNTYLLLYKNKGEVENVILLSTISIGICYQVCALHLVCSLSTLLYYTFVPAETLVSEKV